MNENDAVVEPTDFWYIDSKYHIHCEEYIEYHKDAMDWDLVSQYQTLSEPFIEKFAEALKELQEIDGDEYEKFIKRLQTNKELDKFLIKSNDRISLSTKGMLISNYIIATLLY